MGSRSLTRLSPDRDHWTGRRPGFFLPVRVLSPDGTGFGDLNIKRASRYVQFGFNF